LVGEDFRKGGLVKVPIYEFKCTGCGERGEILRSFEKLHDKLACPVCGSEMQNVIGLTHFRFPGGLPSMPDVPLVEEEY
jgi:putative FmdB family regulatory protein